MLLRRQPADADNVEAQVSRSLFDLRCKRQGHQGFVHSNRTMNCPVQWLESHRVQWPVMRVFQSVPFLSKVQKVRPALDTVVQDYFT